MYRTNILRAAVIVAFGFAPGLPVLAQDHQAHHHHGHHHNGHGQLAQDHTGSIQQGRPAIPQGRHGVGHEHWHEQFYSKLIRKDTKTSCCNLTDCVPTQSRTNGADYEVMVDGEWTSVPRNVIQNVTAPDGGAHVCYPKQPHRDYPKGTLFCVVLPPET